MKPENENYHKSITTLNTRQCNLPKLEHLMKQYILPTNLLKNWEFKSEEEWNKTFDNIYNEIYEMLILTCPEYRPSKKSKKWWTAELSDLRDFTKQAKKRFKKYKTDIHYEEYSNLRNTYHETLRKTKTDHWNNFIENLTTKTV